MAGQQPLKLNWILAGGKYFKITEKIMNQQDRTQNIKAVCQTCPAQDHVTVSGAVTVTSNFLRNYEVSIELLVG